jgi:hypothetical protein
MMGDTSKIKTLSLYGVTIIKDEGPDAPLA